MKKTKKMIVSAAASLSQNAAVVVNCSQVPAKEKTECLSEMLKLIKIEFDDFDFDDVHKNVEKLLMHFFGDDFYLIEELVNEIRVESGLDYDDYDKFIALAEEGRFKEWMEYSNKICAGKPEFADALLDLFFQKTMIPSLDIHNDILIHAYIEDIQPLLN